MQIILGYCGPTDCCLILCHPNGHKQYGIESDAWNILGKYWKLYKQKGEIPDDIGENIYNNHDSDQFYEE